MLAAVDLGNSSLKLGAFDGARLVATERIDVPRSLAEDVVPPAHLLVADEIVVLASSPRRLREFRDWTPRPARVLGDEVRSLVPVSYDHAAELGLDRIAAALGARSLCGGGALVVVDAGTALTVDALTADGRLAAVAIAPGLRACAAALRAAAPHLPLPDLAAGPVTVPARGTADSLRTGHLLAAAGAIERLVAAARGVVGDAGAVVVTGGDAAVLSAHLGFAHRVEPHAVLHGIRAIHATGVR